MTSASPRPCPRPDYVHLLEWLDAGHHAGMEYMSRHAASREHPRNVLEGVCSVVVVSIVYGQKRCCDRAAGADARQGGTLRPRP